MESFDAPPRQWPAPSGDERAQLEAWLDYYRATLLVKCAGLDQAQLATRAIPPSELTLLGLVRHMTLVEQWWFEATFAGLPVDEYYAKADDRDADFHDLASATLEEVRSNYDKACQRSRDLSEGHPLDEIAKKPNSDGAVDLRWIFVHMIEECARHCGHADLLREVLDGTTGD
jgi:uncharacterized damage-inducible protein DinB